MLSHKICLSTGTVAIIDEFPETLSAYRFHIDLKRIRFESNGIRYELHIYDFAQCFADDEKELDKFLRYFGLDWADVNSFENALKLLCMDFEIKCERMGLGGAGDAA